MNEASGSMPYEYTVAEGRGATWRFKRITLIAVYALVAAGLIAAGFASGQVFFFGLAPFAVWLLVLLTWGFTRVEYEYSFFSGTLTVARIRGGRSRRVLCEVELREAAAIMPCDTDSARRIEAYAPEKTVFAASGENAPGLYAMLWQDDKERRTVLFFEPNDRAIKLLRRYNMAALTRRS